MNLIRDTLARARRLGERPPTFWPPTPLGHLPHFQSDPISFFARGYARHGDAFRLKMFGQETMVFCDAEHVRHILVDHVDVYSKRTRGYDKLRLFLGHGMLTSEGEFWRRQRRIAQPAFHRKHINAFADDMVTLAHQLMDNSWERAAVSGEQREISADMMALALNVVVKTVLGSDQDVDVAQVGEDVALINEYAMKAISIPFPVEKLPLPQTREFWAAGKRLDDVVYGIIAERRRKQADDPRDLLSLLMAATDEDTGEKMNDQQLRDEVMTMFLAGHETTAMTLSWTLMLLAKHRDVLTRAHAEVAQVLGVGAKARRAVDADYVKLPYLGQVLNESMRLLPPVWLLARYAERDDQIGRWHVPKGTLVFVPPYQVHRVERHWPEPERFDPERFSEARIHDRPKHAYLPFSTGPRICIGIGFAELETRLILASILQRFSFDYVDEQRIEMEPLITLRPAHGVRLHLRRLAD